MEDIKPFDVNEISTDPEIVPTELERLIRRRKPIQVNTGRYDDPILNEREATHGDFAETARVSQAIKEIYRSSPGWANLTDIQREALDLNATKDGRILSGNPNTKDHWDDKAGYSKLAA